jgi:muramidase (phage lysozyme)
MPQIPTDFDTRSPFAAGQVDAHASPGAFAAPGEALAQGGQEVAQVGAQAEREIGMARAQRNADNLAFAATNEIEQSREKWSLHPNAAEAQDGFDQDVGQIRERYTNASSDPAVQASLLSQLNRHAALTGISVWKDAWALEGSKNRADLDGELQTLSQRAATETDPVLRQLAVNSANEKIKNTAQVGWLTPEGAELRLEKFNNQTYGTILKQGLESENPGPTLAALTRGDYDTKLSIQTREALQPSVDQARGRVLYGIARGGAASVGPQPNATDAEADAALAPIVARESSGNPYVGYTSPATLKAQGQVTDLRNAPLLPSGAPQWAGDMGPQGISHAFGKYQFEPDTWAPIAAKLGITDWRAPGAQDAVARQLYREQGTQPWAASAPPANSAAAFAASPELDAIINRIDGTPGYSDRQKELAIGFATRQHAEWSRATAGERAQLETTTRDGVAMLAAGGDWTPDTGAINRLLPAETAAELTRAIDEAREQGQIRTAVQWATPDDVVALQARSDVRLANPQDFARNQRYAAQLDTEIAKRNNSLFGPHADPAAYVAPSPEVQRAVGAIDPQNPTPGTEAAITASLAQQARLGVPPNGRHALSIPAAQQLATSLAANPDQAPASFKAAQQQYGNAWPQIWHDLTTIGKLPPAYQAVGALDNERDAALLARGLSEVQKSGKAWGDLLGPKVESDIKTSVRSDPAVQQLTLSLSRSGSSAAQIDGIVSAIDGLAFAKSFYDRDTSAAQNAIQSFTGNYEFMPNGGARVPAKLFDTVAGNASAMLQKLDANSIAIPPSFAVTDADRRAHPAAPTADDYLSGLRAAPTWITSPRADALWLMDPQGRLVRGRDAAPLAVPFNTPITPAAPWPPVVPGL